MNEASSENPNAFIQSSAGVLAHSLALTYSRLKEEPDQAAFPNEVDKSCKIKHRKNEEALKCFNFQNWWRKQKVTDPIVRWPLWVPH
ncbi:hypothetical protein TNCV_4263351 [Trichonephila clavipes]|nr:hypothetical protein TNCV_4263351 [Trichonephila clavipes]